MGVGGEEMPSLLLLSFHLFVREGAPQPPWVLGVSGTVLALLLWEGEGTTGHCSQNYKVESIPEAAHLRAACSKGLATQLGRSHVGAARQTPSLRCQTSAQGWGFIPLTSHLPTLSVPCLKR